MTGSLGMSHRLALSLLALVAAVAYAPMLGIPLLEDDYPNLWQSLNYGSPAGFSEMFHDPVFRLRATSFWIMFLLWQVGKVAPLVYHLASLLLHIANVWLLYGICLAWPKMRTAAFWAAGFFAVAEGHQEAVMWFSAINELLQFLFGMGALWCWLRGDRWWPRLAGVMLFALALLSKESAVVILALFLLTGRRGEWRQTAIRLAALRGTGGPGGGQRDRIAEHFLPLLRWQLQPARAFLDHLAALTTSECYGSGASWQPAPSCWHATVRCGIPDWWLWRG